MKLIPLAGLLLTGAAMTGPALAGLSAPLTGHWGGDRANLTLDAQRGRLEQDCALGTFAGPVRPDGKGRFRVQGSYQADTPGPQRADVAPAPATFTGTIRGSSLELTVEQKGSPPRHFTLESGRRVKLLRCL